MNLLFIVVFIVVLHRIVGLSASGAFRVRRTVNLITSACLHVPNRGGKDKGVVIDIHKSVRRVRTVARKRRVPANTGMHIAGIVNSRLLRMRHVWWAFVAWPVGGGGRL